MRKQPKDTECLDCGGQWRDGGGDLCPFCGSPDIAHLV